MGGIVNKAIVVVGLGNPGAVYAHSRHNIGFMCLDRLAWRLKVSFRPSRWRSLQAGAHIAGGIELRLIKPLTYVNESGSAIAPMCRKLGLKAHQIWVVHDDIDLPLGRIRIKQGGGAGGHHGVESIASAIGSSEFVRFRLGVDRPDGDTVSYVLEGFSPGEHVLVDQVVAAAVEAVMQAAERGLISAMERFNRKDQLILPERPPIDA